MAVPSGESPTHAEQYIKYLQAHHETDGRVATWHVDWLSLAWLWGFVIAMTFALLLWVRQYRTTRQRPGIYPIDRWGGYTSELAGPAGLFFVVLTIFLTAFAVAMIVGHLVWGQKF
jgi:hypothetical protein